MMGKMMLMTTSVSGVPTEGFIMILPGGLWDARRDVVWREVRGTDMKNASKLEARADL